MKTLFSLLSILFISSLSFNSTDSVAPEREATSEWTVLFDGSGTDHWRIYNGDHFPSEVWKVEEDALVMRKNSSHSGSFDLITREKYSNFEFELEWMISEGGKQRNLPSRSGAAGKGDLLVRYRDADHRFRWVRPRQTFRSAALRCSIRYACSQSSK